MSMKSIFAIWIGKLIGFLTRIFGIGAGSSAPGLAALKIDPKIIDNLAKQIQGKKIIISATNGKTTTAKMIREIIVGAGRSYVANITGANLDRGIASALINKSNLIGKLAPCDFGVFEVDEAALPQAIKSIKPDLVALGNIFRDQLDRYGEIDNIAKSWKESLQQYKNAILILNADDPSIASIAESLKEKVIFYGIGDYQNKSEELIEHASDSIRCLKCGTDLTYKSRFFSHLGNYNCQKCDFKRPRIDYDAKDIIVGEEQISFIVNGKEKIAVPMSGIYNIYNVLASIAVASEIGIDQKIIKKSLNNFLPAFGRMEKFEFKNREFRITLIKNPAGANAVIETLKQIPQKNIMIFLNDKIADGTDVSWIWDVDLEKMGSINNLACGGTRVYDLALRFKYANFDTKKITIIQDFWQSVEYMIEKTAKNDKIYILPTYTAMLELHKILENKGLVKKIK